jgi:hypothetical protein
MTAIPSLGYYPRTIRIQADGLINRLFITPYPLRTSFYSLSYLCNLFSFPPQFSVTMSSLKEYLLSLADPLLLMSISLFCNYASF